MREAADIKVISPGSMVFIDHESKVQARVLAVSIRDQGRVLYECVWWSGNERKESWVSPCEILPAGEVKHQRVGFTNGQA